MPAPMRQTAYRRAVLLSFPAVMLIQPGQNFHKVAGTVPVVELFEQDFIPRILARSRTARQGKQIGAVGNAARRTLLYGTGADLLH
jgi:hypothetical protein